MRNRMKEYRSHLFSRDYMSGVERNEARIRATGEVFTPKELVDKILDRMFEVDRRVFRDPFRTFLDPACGDGEFLAGVLYRKLEANHEFEQALSTLYGIDIMLDNVKECRRRLLCGYEGGEAIELVKMNILHRNALTYDFSFGEKTSSADFIEQHDWVKG